MGGNRGILVVFDIYDVKMNEKVGVFFQIITPKHLCLGIYYILIKF